MGAYASHLREIFMLYPELFKSMEAVRWNMGTDIPWDEYDASKLTDDQAYTIKMNAITEWAALPATEMFLRDNRDDSDFWATARRPSSGCSWAPVRTGGFPC